MLLGISNTLHGKQNITRAESPILHFNLYTLPWQKECDRPFRSFQEPHILTVFLTRCENVSVVGHEESLPGHCRLEGGEGL